ncbi:MAG: hypothetical protein WD645_05880 [Dehalococcoidia bacterium]
MFPEHPAVGFIFIGGGQPSHNIIPTLVEEANQASIPAFGNSIDFGITSGAWDEARQVFGHCLQWDEPVMDRLKAATEPEIKSLIHTITHRDNEPAHRRGGTLAEVFGKVPPQDDVQGIRLAVWGNWPTIEPTIRHQYAELVRRGKYRIFFMLPVVYEGPTSTAVQVETGHILKEYRRTLQRVAEDELRLPDTPDIKVIKLQWIPADVLQGANSSFALEQGLASRMAVYRGVAA